MTVHEITSCKTYEQYQQMAESEFHISYYPAPIPGGNMLARRLDRTHIYVPLSFDFDEIDAGFSNLAKALEIPLPDSSEKRQACEDMLRETLALVGDTPIAIDYTFCPRPLSLAKLLLDHGFNVRRVYLDVVTGEEKKTFEDLQQQYPNLLLFPTVHASMRFLAAKEDTGWLAIGQKAAHFLHAPHFVNVVEGGGMLGYQAILKTIELMEEAIREEKDLRGLIQIKGMGCAGCI